jgi:hypothetical protein
VRAPARCPECVGLRTELEQALREVAHLKRELAGRIDDQAKWGHNLYRHFDGHGNLLYIGVSIHAINRLGQHRASAEWFQAIERVEIQKFSTREEAEAAEMAAIAAEKPRYNKIGNGVTGIPPRPRVPPVTGIPPRPRGRPPTGKALSGAERLHRFRAKRKAAR